MTGRVLAVGLIVLTTALSAASQSPSKILSAASKALGGEKALRTITSFRAEGTFKRVSDAASGRYSISTAGGSFLETFDLDGKETTTSWNGRSGWRRDPRSGARTVTGDAARDLSAEAAHRSVRWHKGSVEKLRFISGGTAIHDGRRINVVNVATSKGARYRLGFDAATNLLVREEFAYGDEVRIFDYSDHRPVNGIYTPFAVRATLGGEQYDIRLDSVRYNVPVEKTAFAFPVVSNEPLPNIPDLLNDIRANADKVDNILENYSYSELRSERSRDKQGNLVEKSSEKRLLTFYKGFRIERTIERNRKPLSADDQEKEDRDAARQVADIEKRIAERQRKQEKERERGSGTAGTPNGEGQRLTIADALKGSLLLNARRERFKGRDVIVFDYEPDRSFKPKTRNEKIFAICTGAVWVDAATRQVVRLDAVLSESAGNFIAKAKRGASFSIENELVNNEIWLPSRADVDLEIKVLFAGIQINNLILYGDYRRFETEVKDARVGDGTKPL